MDQLYSSPKFQSYFENSPQSLILKADPPYFTILAVSNQFLAISGTVREEILHKPLFEVFPDNEHDPSGRQRAMDTWMEVIQTKKRVDIPVYQYEIRDPQTGELETFYWSNANEPVLDEDGNVAYIINTTKNVTEEVRLRQLAEKANMSLEEHQQRINSLLMKAPVGMAFLSRNNYVIQYANEAACAIWNKGRPEQVIGISIFDLLPELRQSDMQDMYDRVMETCQSFTLTEYPVDLERDGTLQTSYFDLYYSPLTDLKNEVTGIMVMANDVSHTLEARKTLRDAEQRLRLAVEAANQGIFDLNLITGELVHNERLNRLLGYPDGLTLVHTDVRKNMHDEDRVKVERAFDDALKTGRFNYEARVNWTDGEQHWIKTLGKVFFDAQGQPVRMLGSTMDITEQVEYECRLDEINSALQQEISKFEIITEFIPQIIWSANTNGSIDYVNKGWAYYTGLPMEAAYASTWQEVVHPDDFDRVQQAWKNSMLSGESYQIEYRLRKHDSEYNWHLERGKPLLDEDGKPVKWFGATMNINDHVELQKQKDNFLAIASHELKTPVTSIKAYAQVLEMMLRNAGDEQKASMVTKMGIQVNRLTTLIADLLDVTKIHTGKMQFNDAFFDFNEMLDEVIDDLQRTTLKHQLVKEYRFNGQIYGDRDRISQVVINLLTNAIKYSPDADRIIVATHTNDNDLELSVQDFGIGISADKKDHVFEQFYRVSGSKQHTFPGLGLGLYISSEIIRREGGRIWVNSEEGEGSVFYFSLPLNKPVA
ncbi:PAS domain-containing protein [Mucilaginibacter sp. RS28]|uniref:histidine kinase n=1 Tax=Mucilaginibacter straminoryzae TaxID=2932774 RepID=A0A9X2B836_9SPHI|nr:PAS domain-containing protein [Mucilaginibacter straminoryzae]MCJ8209056.1 PAS domain-containing protein [Mucilaginibacter straminoryzae]